MFCYETIETVVDSSNDVDEYWTQVSIRITEPPSSVDSVLPGAC